MVRHNALKIRSWADVFRFESGVTTEGWTSLLFYYDHIDSIVRNTQLPRGFTYWRRRQLPTVPFEYFPLIGLAVRLLPILLAEKRADWHKKKKTRA